MTIKHDTLTTDEITEMIRFENRYRATARELDGRAWVKVVDRMDAHRAVAIVTTKGKIFHLTDNPNDSEKVDVTRVDASGPAQYIGTAQSHLAALKSVYAANLHMGNPSEATRRYYTR